MHHLDDIYRASRALLAGDEPLALADTESPTFNAAWFIYQTMGSKNVEDYSVLWGAIAAVVMTKKPDILDAKVIRTATQHVAMSYILAGLHSAEHVRGTPKDQHYSQFIAPKILLITQLAKDIQSAHLPVSPTGTLPRDVAYALGEFYSLCIFAYQQFRPNLDEAFHEGIGNLILNFKKRIAQFDLPIFLHSDDRLKQSQAPQGSAPLPSRTGIAATSSGGAQVYDLSALRRSVANKDI